MQNPPRILIVDDHALNRQLPALVLTEYGWHCEEATNGEEALGRLAATAYDVVLLDLGLPGISGYEVCRRIRADDTLKHLRVIAYSSLAPSELDIASAGFDALLGKPVSRDALLALLDIEEGNPHS
jgi:CheY-like chemotaxis protein